ncbi:cyclic nucleotide-binding domain-containing protein [Xylophilus rhododendri]|uniref:Cyclic nucleotide-binding domain-containing protein n=1 Tax=Xylophilus rhododendri TaxID=2697032 RepID=A0A857J969_9BURK|nr:Crp/Fnr family transcriptional regulator [Xylophilus rhododendri]QHJ00278.1 cyclic nucleotide-binding domain-containing protein [Xylophilus rhododendri]
MAIVTELDLLRRVPLFGLLTAEQAQFLSTSVSKRRFRRGEALVERGQRSDAFFVLISGRARVIVADERGREVIFASLRPGDPVGEMSLIDGEPHSATVQAETQTDVLALDREAFLRCLPPEGSVGHAVLVGLVRRLRKADRSIESLALMDVYGRVARVLMDGAAPSTEGEGMVVEKVTRQDIAKMVGASREMVSRVMKDLEERGFVEVRDDGSMLLHEGRLSSMTDLSGPARTEDAA